MFTLAWGTGANLNGDGKLDLAGRVQRWQLGHERRAALEGK